MSNEAIDDQAFFESLPEMAGGGMHCLGPDELLMRAESAQEVDGDGAAAEAEAMWAGCECMISILGVVTRDAMNVTQVRDRVAALALRACLPMEVPASIWEGRRQERQAAAACVHGLVWDQRAASALLMLLAAKGWEPRVVGFRTLLLLYAYQKFARLRPPMAQSFETIGTAVGLKARNKRSAVSAAMQSFVAELVRSMQRRSRRRENFNLWFEKSRDTKAALQASMKGKRNRGGAVKAERGADA